jgi:hypothetical protein
VLFIEADGLLRIGQEISQRVDLFAKRLLPFAGCFELLFDDLPALRIKIGSLDLSLKLIDGVAADAPLQRFSQVGIDHQREGAEFTPDGLGFPNQNGKDAILGPLPVNEVVAEDLVARLKFAVNPAVPLFHAAGVRWDIKMEQITAVGLEVEAFAGGISRNQDAHGMLARLGIEGELDRLAFLGWGGAVKDGDPFVGPIGCFNRGLKLLMEVTLGVVVLGEDDDANLVPSGWLRRALPWPGQIGALILANPFDQPLDTSVGQRSRLIGDLCHLVEELLLWDEEFTAWVVFHRSGRGGAQRGDLDFLFGEQVVFG